MKEYQFQFTKAKDIFLVLLACIVIFAIVMFICVKLSIDKSLMVAIELVLIFLTFRLLKKKAVSNCTAKLSDTSVMFEFENETKTINFNELISYKSYYGKNGPILYLKDNIDNFKIFANDNFCKTDDFKIFSDDTIIQLGKYKDNNSLTLIHEGSIYATKAFLYFLFITTSIYFLSFLIVRKDIRPYTGFGGGLYLLIMWFVYFNKRDLKSK